MSCFYFTRFMTCMAGKRNYYNRNTLRELNGNLKAEANLRVKVKVLAKQQNRVPRNHPNLNQATTNSR